jgi:hypothetical protein
MPQATEDEMMGRDLDDDFDDAEENFFDCHMGPDGYCGAAGSEDCEFDCPYRRAQRLRASTKEQQP